MTAIDFPNSPTLNQTFTSSGRTWKWNGSVWANVGIVAVSTESPTINSPTFVSNITETYATSDVAIYPGSLSGEVQVKIFAPAGVPAMATAGATFFLTGTTSSSLNIDNINFVIDSVDDFGYIQINAHTASSTNNAAVDAYSANMPFGLTTVVLNQAITRTITPANIGHLNSPTITNPFIVAGSNNVSSTELGYLDGVTSAIQTQIDDKAAASHTHTVSQITDYVPGSRTLISTTTTAAGATSATVSSIPQTYQTLEFSISMSGAAGPANATMTFNGSTTATYSMTYFSAFSTTGTGTATPVASYSYGQASFFVPGLHSGGATYLTIPEYASTTIKKNFTFYSFSPYTTTSSIVGSGFWGGNSFVPTAINAINFTFSNAGTTGITTIKVWGIK